MNQGGFDGSSLVRDGEAKRAKGIPDGGVNLMKLEAKIFRHSAYKEGSQLKFTWLLYEAEKVTVSRTVMKTCRIRIVPILS